MKTRSWVAVEDFNSHDHEETIVKGRLLVCTLGNLGGHASEPEYDVTRHTVNEKEHGDCTGYCHVSDRETNVWK